VVAVAVLAEPPPLAGCLTGLPASERGTVALAIFGARISHEQLGATAAFASGLRAAHHEPHCGERRTGRKPKRRNWKKMKKRRRKKSFKAKRWKKTPPKKTEFQPAGFLLLSFRR
jgi:hypothetical protein